MIPVSSIALLLSSSVRDLVSKTPVDAEGVSIPSPSSEFADTLFNTQSVTDQHAALGTGHLVASGLNPQAQVEPDAAGTDLGSSARPGISLPSTGNSLPVTSDLASAGGLQADSEELPQGELNDDGGYIESDGMTRPLRAGAEFPGWDGFEFLQRGPSLSLDYVSPAKSSYASDAPAHVNTPVPLTALELLSGQTASVDPFEAPTQDRDSQRLVQAANIALSMKPAALPFLQSQVLQQFAVEPALMVLRDQQTVAQAGLLGEKGTAPPESGARLLTTKDIPAHSVSELAREGQTSLRHPLVKDRLHSLLQSSSLADSPARPTVTMNAEHSVVADQRPVARVDASLRSLAPLASAQTNDDGISREGTMDPRRAMQLAASAQSPVAVQSAELSQQKVAETLVAVTPIAATTIPRVAVVREMLAKIDPTARAVRHVDTAVSEPVQRLLAFVEGEPSVKPAAIEVRPAQYAHLPAEPSALSEVKGGGADSSVKAEQNMRGVSLGLLPQQVAQSLARLAMSRGRFAIALSPQTLGSIDIEFSEHRGEVSIAIAARETGTRELLEQMLPRLREALSDAGVSLADLDIRKEHQQQRQQQDADTLRELRSTGSQQIDEQLNEQGALLKVPENASFHVFV